MADIPNAPSADHDVSSRESALPLYPSLQSVITQAIQPVVAQLHAQVAFIARQQTDCMVEPLCETLQFQVNGALDVAQASVGLSVDSALESLRSSMRQHVDKILSPLENSLRRQVDETLACLFYGQRQGSQQMSGTEPRPMDTTMSTSTSVETESNPTTTKQTRRRRSNADRAVNSNSVSQHEQDDSTGRAPRRSGQANSQKAVPVGKQSETKKNSGTRSTGSRKRSAFDANSSRSTTKPKSLKGSHSAEKEQK